MHYAIGWVVGVVVGVFLHIHFGATVDKIDTQAGVIVHKGLTYVRTKL